MKRMEGYIDSVYSNYGVIVTQDGGHTVKYLFYIFPDMIHNRVFKSTKKNNIFINNLSSERS